MEMQIAKFEKVSFEQFEKDINHFYPSNDINNLRVLYDNLELPNRSTQMSAGYDFHMPVTLNIDSSSEDQIKTVAMIPTGIKAKIDEGWVLNLFPRSSYGLKYNMRLINTVGIIDADYYNSDNEGHIIICLEFSVNQPITIDFNERFCQGLFIKYGLAYENEVTDIRNGGFGSTDKSEE